MDVQACLDRIGYNGPLQPKYETLRALQGAFLLAVPVENLDIHLGRRIEITGERVFEKVVGAKRGGFCFELNGLFHDLLAALGFEVTFLAARMIRAGDNCPEFGHMALRVDLDEPWLVDAGNGKSFREPLLLDGSNESWAEDFGYRVDPAGDAIFVMEKRPGGEWLPRYRCFLKPRKRSEFEPACDWTQTSPASVFTKNRMCTIARKNGRATLMNNILTIEGEQGSRQTSIPENQLQQCVREHFGIVIQ